MLAIVWLIKVAPMKSIESHLSSQCSGMTGIQTWTFNTHNNHNLSTPPMDSVYAIGKLMVLMCAYEKLTNSCLINIFRLSFELSIDPHSAMVKRLTSMGQFHIVNAIC